MADSFRLVICDRWGHVFERDGTPYRSDSGRPHFEQVFADLESARSFAETVVREHPHAECDVFRGSQIVLQHWDRAWRRTQEEQTRRMFAEHRRRVRRVLATIIGGIVFLIAVVLYVWFR